MTSSTGTTTPPDSSTPTSHRSEMRAILLGCAAVAIQYGLLVALMATYLAPLPVMVAISFVTVTPGWLLVSRAVSVGERAIDFLIAAGMASFMAFAHSLLVVGLNALWSSWPLALIVANSLTLAALWLAGRSLGSRFVVIRTITPPTTPPAATGKRTRRLPFIALIAGLVALALLATLLGNYRSMVAGRPDNIPSSIPGSTAASPPPTSHAGPRTTPPPTALPTTPRKPAQQTDVAGIASRSRTGTVSWYYGNEGCAVKFLKRGTMVRITDPATGRSTTCRVTMYGPGLKGRVGNLPKRLFAKLASPSQGLATVVITRVD